MRYWGWSPHPGIEWLNPETEEEKSYLDRREDGLMPATFCLGEKSMGQSFERARMGIKDVSAMWLKAPRGTKEGKPDLREEGGRGPGRSIGELRAGAPLLAD